MRLILIVLLIVCCASAAAQAPDGVTDRKGVVGDPLDLDPSFAGDGTVTVQIAQRDYGRAGFFESSGEIVILGDSEDGNPSNREAILLRLGADGSEGPIAQFPASGFGCSVPRAFLGGMRLSSGDYLGGGYVQRGCSGLPRHFNLLRLNPAGGLVAEFETVPFNNQLAYVFALAEQADGKVVAAGLISGSGYDAPTFDLGVARFLPNGSLDTAFATGGTYAFDLDNDTDYAIGVMVDRQGRILVTGYGTSSTTDRDVLLLALTETGVLDVSFGAGGVFQYDRAGFPDSAADVAQTASGRILLAGTTRPDEATREFTVLGLTESGVLDPGFSDDGIAIVQFGSQVANASAITIGPAGRVFVAGSAEIGGTGLEARDAAVAVLLPDGRMDPSYNGGAGKTFTFGDQPIDLPGDVTVNALGTQILVTGYSQSADGATQQIAAARLIGLDPFIFSDGFEATLD